MYLYETHLHTVPVSRCAHTDVRAALGFYKELGYAGVFITNHFIDGNINIDPSEPYEKRINFYFSDYEEGVKIGKEIGLDVFCGVEMSYGGTDFLVYGLDKQWYLDRPEIEQMEKSALLTLMNECGALLIQAHPFREDPYIDHIRLYPRHVHGVETFNANRKDDVNEMAELYAKHYGLPAFAGSDNHGAGYPGYRPRLGGIQTETRIASEAEFVELFKCGKATPFRKEGY